MHGQKNIKFCVTYFPPKMFFHETSVIFRPLLTPVALYNDAVSTTLFIMFRVEGRLLMEKLKCLEKKVLWLSIADISMMYLYGVEKLQIF